MTNIDVHSQLNEDGLLVDGYDIVFDLERSLGTILYDSKHNVSYIDMFSFFGSMPLGFNHPKIVHNKTFKKKLLQAALVKPSCSDVYTQAMADFVHTFRRIVPKAFTHLFFVEGGSVAIENGMKAAFDWKAQKCKINRLNDVSILHFDRCFHGRTGYTLSVTNSYDARKTKLFPKFEHWPRMPVPRNESEERAIIEAIENCVSFSHLVVAAILVEPIQGEGGDVHFSSSFFKQLRTICNRKDILLIFDEVQCGMGLTGTWWAFEQLNVQPDIFCFGKKSQVCGIAATSRMDEVKSVFHESSRINSTFGGNLCDMVRCQRYIEVIEENKILDHVKAMGKILLDELINMEKQRLIYNARGRGLMCAFDVCKASTEQNKAMAQRDKMVTLLREKYKILILPCGDRSIRFRPVLDVTKNTLITTLSRLKLALLDLCMKF